jgi:hypothetical protein
VAASLQSKEGSSSLYKTMPCFTAVDDFTFFALLDFVYLSS